MKAGIPRSLMFPMLFALAVEYDMFASRSLNTQLFNFQFTESCNEIVRFKQGVVILITCIRRQFHHFGDNVDHNIATLDRRGTFHGMGVVAAITNKGNFITKQSVRLHPKTYTEVNELVWKKAIMSYHFPSHCGLDNIIFSCTSKQHTFLQKVHYW